MPINPATKKEALKNQKQNKLKIIECMTSHPIPQNPTKPPKTPQNSQNPNRNVNIKNINE